jgi:hypothetical protein
MEPKKSGVSRTVLTIETKQEMSDIARQYGLNKQLH